MVIILLVFTGCRIKFIGYPVNTRVNPNLQNTFKCCGFFCTRFYFSDRRQNFGYPSMKSRNKVATSREL